MDIGKIVKLVTLLVAIVAGVMGGFPQSALIVAILGLVSGYFVDEENHKRLLLMTLALIAVQGSLGVIPGIGGYISGALGGIAAALSAASITVIVTILVNAVKP